MFPKKVMFFLPIRFQARYYLFSNHDAEKKGRKSDVSRTASWLVRRTFALGASSFWRTWRPHAHHFSADSLFHGLPMCSVFRSVAFWFASEN